MSKNYVGVEDLLIEESFLAWFFKTDAASIRHWEAWMAEDRTHRLRAEQAADFLRAFQIQERSWSSERVTLAESRLLKRIKEAEKKISPSGRSGSEIPARTTTYAPIYRKWWVAAASVILLIAGLGSMWLFTRRNAELHTAFGEIGESKLPDGTEVKVNADSRLTYSTGWKDGKDREVWLNGEAFFHVSKTPLKSRFIVHTDHFDVIVTGTQFNVVSRQDKANIMLKEGSVTLRTAAGKEIKMIPGDFIEFHPDGLRKRLVNDDSVLAWKDHKLIFENTSLREVAHIIQEHYGIPVQLGDEGLADSTISGIQSYDNLDEFLQSLEAATGYIVVKDGDLILIRRH